MRQDRFDLTSIEFDFPLLCYSWETQWMHLEVLVGLVTGRGLGSAGCAATAVLEEALLQRGVEAEGGALRLSHLTGHLAPLHSHRQHRARSTLQPSDTLFIPLFR
jgi:hypothetical protein